MQNPTHSALYDILSLLTYPFSLSLAAIIAYVLGGRQQQRKLVPEVSLINAQAEKEQAETMQLRAGVFFDAVERINDQQTVISELRKTVDDQAAQIRSQQRMIGDQANKIQLQDTQLDMKIRIHE